MKILRIADRIFSAGTEVKSKSVSLDQTHLGNTGDKFYCQPGLVWYQRVEVCDWPYNLPSDHHCYLPLE